MTDVNGDLMDIAGFRGDGTMRVRSTVTRLAQNSDAVVTAAWHEFDIVAGLVALTDLDPGPAEVVARMGSWRESWKVTIPDEQEPISFSTLLDAYVEYDPAIVGQAQSARDAAIAARTGAESAQGLAETARQGAEQAYANLTDDIANAADQVRAQVESAADDAVQAKGAAEYAQGQAEAARLGAESARDTAVSAKDLAVGAKTDAETAKTDSETAKGLAEAAQLAAEFAQGEAETAQQGAETAQGLAETARTQAQSARGDAQTAKGDAENARDDAQYAKNQAENARLAAETAQGLAEAAELGAVTAKDDAVIAKNQAQAAANSFGLSAGTVTTGSPSSSASVTVSGSGPAYTLNFTIPRGQQGAQGPQGTGLQLQGRVATYASLPSGLNNSSDKGKAYIVDSDGLLYIWDGTGFPASGSGLPLVGAKGDNGKSAYQVAVDNGFVGTAGEWLTSLVGDPGDSAYDVAVNEGFVGDKTAWLASLKGADGADGATSWNDLDDKPSTFPPIIGSTSSTAKAGDWMPAWSDVKSKPGTFPPTIGSGSTQAVAGDDSRLTDARTPTAHVHAAGDVTSGTLHADRIPEIAKAKLAAGVQSSLDKADSAAQIVDASFGMVVFGKDTTREAGTGDLPMGVQVPRACTIAQIRYWCDTADASGNLTVELRKNGTAISGSSATIPAGSQVGGQSVTGLSVALAQWDKITVHVTGVGATPGKALACVVQAVTA